MQRIVAHADPQAGNLLRPGGQVEQAGQPGDERVVERGWPSCSIAGVYAFFGSLSIAASPTSVHDEPTENSQCTPPLRRRRRRCARAGRERTRPRPGGPARGAGTVPGSAGDGQVEQGDVVSARSWTRQPPGRGSMASTSPVLSQVARFGQNPVPPL